MKDGKSFDPEKVSVKAGAFELSGVQQFGIKCSAEHDSLETLLIKKLHLPYLGETKLPSTICTAPFRTFCSMRQYIQDRGQRRVAPPVKNSGLSQFSSTDSASLYSTLAVRITTESRPPDRS